MKDQRWQEEYQEWRSLKPFQKQLLEDGPKSQSQAWLVNNMWCDWKELKKLKEAELPSIYSDNEKDPWFE